MNVNRKIYRLKKQVENMELKSRVKFFDSHDEYDRAYKNGEIKKHHICFIEDVADDDEVMKDG